MMAVIAISVYVTIVRPSDELMSMSMVSLKARAQRELAAIPLHSLVPTALSRSYDVARHHAGRKLAHWLMHVRILNSSAFVRHLPGRVASKRVSRWLHGLHLVLNDGGLPDVELIIDLNDIPACNIGPFFSTNKRPGSGCILGPCYSLLQRDYFGNSSVYSYAVLRRFAAVSPWRARRRAIWFDLTSAYASAGANKGVRRLFDTWLRPHGVVRVARSRAVLTVTRSLGAPTKSGVKGCEHQYFAVAEGNGGWTMRFKNVLLCGSLALWFRTSEQLASTTSHEFWEDAVENGTHFWQVSTPAQLSRMPTNAEAIAAAGEDVVTSLLHPTSVITYLRVLLVEYARLQNKAIAMTHGGGWPGRAGVKNWVSASSLAQEPLAPFSYSRPWAIERVTGRKPYSHAPHIGNG